MVAYAGQAILHATIAALVVEALMRAWRVQDPGERLALRWVVLLSPLATAGFVVLAPGRATDAFSLQWALFAGMHWNELPVGGVGVAAAATALLALLGGVLYLRDALPFLTDRVGRQTPEAVLPDAAPAVARVRARLARVDAAARPSPSVIVLDRPTPVFLCAGVDRPAIIVSTGALDRLSDAELDAATVHELAHLERRDPVMGWCLMAVRTFQCFNPAIQILGRQAVQELERRADLAVVRKGGAGALASAISRLARDPESHSDLVQAAEPASLSERFHSRAHQHAVDDRCARILEEEVPVEMPWRKLRIALAATAVTLILYLVV
ncbi:MAG: M56 family metallopeptidase [Acidobacteria bacterium]|nr:M56 family metallopeptidase [Acidobacteriota bacterium]